MNTHFQRPTVVQPSQLYQDHSEGTHFFVHKNLVSYSFRAPMPFLSTGNFDQLRPADRQAASQKHMSCGNFMTSTKEEDWDNLPDEFRVSRFGQSAFKHTQNNIKYNISPEDTNPYARRIMPAGNGRARSEEEIQEVLEPLEPAMHNFSKQAKPSCEEKPARSHFISKPVLTQTYAPRTTEPNARSPIQNVDDEEDSNLEDDLEDSGNDQRLGKDDDDALEEEDQHQGPMMNEVFDDIKEKCLDHLLNKKSGKRQDQLTIVNEERIDQGERYSPKQLLNMSFESKEASIKVQAYIRLLDEDNLNHVAGYMCRNLNHLIMDKYGNYVVQFLVELHKPSKDFVHNVCIDNFVKFAENEYGSRIMQKMAAISPKFCATALKVFSKYFDRLIKNITGSILLSKLISCAQNCQEYRFAIEIMQANKEYLKKAYFNRMLATLVNVCPPQLLAEIVYIIRNHIWVLMNDKFGNYVLQIVVEREDREGTKLIKNACLKNGGMILTRKYPKFLIIKIVEMETDYEFCTDMMDSVSMLDMASIWQILSRRDSSMLTLLIMSKQRPEHIPDMADLLLRTMKAYNGRTLPFCKLV